jgi:hypothetical protein
MHDDKLRLRKAVVLFAFLQIVLMWEFQERLSQILTPLEVFGILGGIQCFAINVL